MIYKMVQISTVVAFACIEISDLHPDPPPESVGSSPVLLLQLVELVKESDVLHLHGCARDTPGCHKFKYDHNVL